jgi:hypothetical protein
MAGRTAIVEPLRIPRKTTGSIVEFVGEKKADGRVTQPNHDGSFGLLFIDFR